MKEKKKHFVIENCGSGDGFKYCNKPDEKLYLDITMAVPQDIMDEIANKAAQVAKNDYPCAVPIVNRIVKVPLPTLKWS